MPASNHTHPLPFNPEDLPRELKQHYISAGAEEIDKMLKAVGLKDLEDLFGHIPEDYFFEGPLPLPEEKEYEEVQRHLEAISEKNLLCESFLGDGLPHYTVHEIVPFVSSIRNLTTAYTPYQPERSQGTLMTQWIYQCLMSMLTGFEAINTSLYDRASAIFEAISVSLRLKRKGDTALVSEGLYPGDMEVLETLAENTAIKLRKIPLDGKTGRISLPEVREEANTLGEAFASMVFPQINSLGLLEEVDGITDLCRERGAKSIAVIDPALLSTGGLKPPSRFGEGGADIIVGEAQHLAVAPNFGGPGLGLFGIRFNDKTKNSIRSTPGRYVGKGRDLSGRECRVIVLSTREQHIRKEKATSNICSNQAFLATLAGAALLARGESGMKELTERAREQAREAARQLTSIPRLKLAFPETPFCNEFVIELPEPVDRVVATGVEANLFIGANVSNRLSDRSRNLLKISFSNRKCNLERLVAFFEKRYGKRARERNVPPIPENSLRKGEVGLPAIELEKIKAYYVKLGELNVSPDDGCYPLGSCTMKYNPYLNDWAADLPGFTGLHPQAPVESSQGSLEVLHEIQEWFKGITGLAAVTTQPVAGAQGELVGLKLFQAYHKDRGDLNRNVILIPKSAHGTNFASAAMAGFYNTQGNNGQRAGIVLLEADQNGTISPGNLDERIARYRHRISGIMITNPNTSGIFETHFKSIAEKIHALGGLVYMDGANLNAIAGWINLEAMGVDAVHSNLHKTWTIPHGGGGPGDAIVAVSKRLADFIPGFQIIRENNKFIPVKPSKSIGSVHRHWGNFAHKVRCYAYLLRLGETGIKRMSAMAVLSARYLYEKLRHSYPTLPAGAASVPRMHEFILTLEDADFEILEKAGIPKPIAATRLGKLFLDFGFHAPTVAWPEAFGIMIEPTESYTLAELDRFGEAVQAMLKLLRRKPETFQQTPFFTPVERINEVEANRKICLSEPLRGLPPIHPNRLSPKTLGQMPIEEIFQRILSSAESGNL